MKTELKYIGQQITIRSLRDFILDLGLTQENVILLHPINFDDIVLEYRQIYNESILLPYSLLGVLIKEDKSRKIPKNRVGLISNNIESVLEIEQDDFTRYYDIEVAYRCGWCGNIVSENGEVLADEERQEAIEYISSSPNPVVKLKHGKCCTHMNR